MNDVPQTPEQPNEGAPVVPAVSPEALLDDTALAPMELDDTPSAPSETTEVVASATEEGKPLQEAIRQNFKIELPYTSTGMSELEKNKETSFLPPAAPDRIRDATDSFKQTDEKSEEYAAVLGAGYQMTPREDMLLAASRRLDADWRQKIDSSVGPLAAMTPKSKATSTHTVETARRLIRSAMKLGTSFAVPLWHSGFWITLKAPTEGEILELAHRVSNEKVIVGRQTYGLLFSNVSSYTTQHVLKFIEDHLYETSLKIPEGESIGKYIKLPDLTLLIWGLACVIYPTGFQYRRACCAGPDKCNHVVEEKIMPSRLFYMDRSRLTDKQIAHMTNRGKERMTVEQIKSYQSEFVHVVNKLIKINDKLSFELHVSSVEDHIEAGHRWVGMMEDSYSRILSYDENMRSDYIINQVKSTMARMYAHCVSKVIVEDQEFDHETNFEVLENALDDLSANPTLSDSFIEQVRDYLESVVMAFIAVPTYDCPSCGEHQTKSSDGRPSPELIPLDPLQTFFFLAYQKVKLISARDLRATV